MIRFAGDSFKFEKRRQHFIRTHNETFSVAAIRALCAPVSARSLLPKSFNPESSTLSTQKMHTRNILAQGQTRRQSDFRCAAIQSVLRRAKIGVAQCRSLT